MPEAAIWLFSYGTLRRPEVQRGLFAREIESHDDVLAGFAVGTIRLGDREYLILRPGRPTDRVSGVALAVTEAELLRADAYETSDYVRIGVVLASGRRAQVYVASEPNTRIV